MKRNALALSIAAAFLLFVDVVQAEEKHTISLGYAQSNVSGNMKELSRTHSFLPFEGKAKDLKGINLKYRYEFDQSLGIIGSLTSTYLKNESSNNYGAYGNGNIKTEVSYISLMAGPTWRFNEYVSVYGMAGIARFEGEIKTSGAIALVQKNVKKTSNNIAVAAGVQFNPVPYIAIDLGYEYTKAKFNDVKDLSGKNKNYSGNIGTWTLGVGYRF